MHIWESELSTLPCLGFFVRDSKAAVVLRVDEPTFCSDGKLSDLAPSVEPNASVVCLSSKDATSESEWLETDITEMPSNAFSSEDLSTHDSAGKMSPAPEGCTIVAAS